MSLSRAHSIIGLEAVDRAFCRCARSFRPGYPEAFIVLRNSLNQITRLWNHHSSVL